MNMEAAKKIMDKIPAFRDFSFSQAFQLLRKGQKKTYAKHEVLCRAGDESTDLYILLAGELSIQRDDVEITRITPADIVGEMGLITGLPRCTTIEVVEDAILIKIDKQGLNEALEEKYELAAKFYKNILGSICQRLRDANVQIVES